MFNAIKLQFFPLKLKLPRKLLIAYRVVRNWPPSWLAFQKTRAQQNKHLLDTDTF